MLHDDEHKDKASVTLVASLSRDAKDDALVRRRIRELLGLVGVCCCCSASANGLVMVGRLSLLPFAVSAVSCAGALPILAASSANRRSSLRRSRLLARAELGRMRLLPPDELAVVVVESVCAMTDGHAWRVMWTEYRE